MKSCRIQTQQVSSQSVASSVCSTFSTDLFGKLHSRFLGPIALVVDSCGDADHNGREEVTRHVVVLLSGVFALKDLHQHEVQLNPLETHPGERGQEEEVEDPSDDGAPNLGFGQSKKRRRRRKDVVSFNKVSRLHSRCYKKKDLNIKRSSLRSIVVIENCISHTGYFITQRTEDSHRCCLTHSHVSAKVRQEFNEYSVPTQALAVRTFQLSIGVVKI